MPSAIVALLSLYLSFLCFGLLVWIRSRTYGHCHCPYTLAHIKVFGSPHFACLCLLAPMLYACVSLPCSWPCHVWHPQQVCGCVVTSNTHVTLFRCNHLVCIAMMPVASCILFPFSASCDDFAYHACLFHLFAFYASLHACLHVHAWALLAVRCPYFNTMKLWTPDPNLHLSLVDAPFCLLTCFFAFFFVCLLSYLFAFLLICLHPCFYACHVYHAYLLMPLSYTLCTFSFHCLSASFLSLPLHVHTWSEDVWS